MGLISSGQRGLSILEGAKGYINTEKHRVFDLPRSHPQQYHWTLAPSDQITDAPERISPSRSCSEGSICTLEQASVKSYCTMHQTIVSFTHASACNWFSNYNYYTNYILHMCPSSITITIILIDYNYNYNITGVHGFPSRWKLMGECHAVMYKLLHN